MDGRPTIVALALGSNLGDRRGNLHAALAALPPSVSILRLASLFESEAVSDISQPDFLNSALLGSTRLDPEGLLAVLKSIELRIGRRAGHRWGPRPLDLDLLLYGDRLEHRPELTIPHPRLTRRRFVLDPLAEIAPDLGVPPDLLTVAELLDRLQSEPAPRRIAAAAADAASWTRGESAGGHLIPGPPHL